MQNNTKISYMKILQKIWDTLIEQSILQIMLSNFTQIFLKK